MNPFQYERASDVSAALAAGARAGARYLGGGANLVDLMRETIEHPETLVDATGLSREIEEAHGGGLRISAGVKNTTVAADRRVRQRFPLLAQAILAGASAQIRNMATVGGNLRQRTRCQLMKSRTRSSRSPQPRPTEPSPVSSARLIAGESSTPRRRRASSAEASSWGSASRSWRRSCSMNAAGGS
jgi:CO/xanthine dehydrogenase FAD-binding subunit